MSGPIPFLGSKISLISKSEIRYEGILYTIDAQESIIALAKVRSFGTEDRPTEMPVPARDEVYEYIIFRGTDIKKIEVCDTPKQQTLPGGLHNDPAIVQHSAPAVPSSFQAAPFSRQSLGPIGGGLGLSYGGYGQSMTQQGLPGAGGFPIAAAATSQPSELNSTVGSGGSGGGVIGGSSSIDAPALTSPVGAASGSMLPAPIGAGPGPQGGVHTGGGVVQHQHPGRNKCHLSTKMLGADSGNHSKMRYRKQNFKPKEEMCSLKDAQMYVSPAGLLMYLCLLGCTVLSFLV